MSTIHTKPLLLVSNDDGIDSFFLRSLVLELLTQFDVIVAAPAGEQSWVGRGMTRSGEIKAKRHMDWPCEAWAIEGKPADCVNIALHHLCDRKPDAVVSGMNLGFNTTLVLTLSSGTVAAATEGALAGLPAFAFSLALQHDEFMQVSRAKGHRDDMGNQYTKIAAEHACRLVDMLLQQEVQQTASQFYKVHNINIPARVTRDTPVVQTELALNQMPSLFTQQDTSEHVQPDESTADKVFKFTFSKDWAYQKYHQLSDIHVVKDHMISHSILCWDKISELG